MALLAIPANGLLHFHTPALIDKLCYKYTGFEGTNETSSPSGTTESLNAYC